MSDQWEAFSEREWLIVGAGRMGRTLGLFARELDVTVVSTWNRSREVARKTGRLLGL